jgi:hypothetical protein
MFGWTCSRYAALKRSSPMAPSRTGIHRTRIDAATSVYVLERFHTEWERSRLYFVSNISLRSLPGSSQVDIASGRTLPNFKSIHPTKEKTRRIHSQAGRMDRFASMSQAHREGPNRGARPVFLLRKPDGKDGKDKNHALATPPSCRSSASRLCAPRRMAIRWPRSAKPASRSIRRALSHALSTSPTTRSGRFFASTLTSSGNARPYNRRHTPANVEGE